MGTVSESFRRGCHALAVAALPAVLMLPAAPSTVDAATPTSGYRTVDLGPRGAFTSTAVAVNDRGLIVGSSSNEEEPARATVWQAPGGGPPRRLAGPPSDALLVGDRGEVIGYVVDEAGSNVEISRWWRGARTVLDAARPRTFLRPVDIDGRGRVLITSSNDSDGSFGARIWDDGRLQEVTGLPPVQPGSHPRVPWAFPVLVDMNERTQIVGNQGRVGDIGSAFVWQDGVTTYLPSLPDPGPPTQASVGVAAINARGVIAGASTTAGGAELHAVVWRDGRVADLGMLPGAQSCQPAGAASLSEAGHVVGTCRGPGLGEPRGVIWHRGTVTDLGDIGGQTVQPVAVNDRGQVVGLATTPDNFGHAFVWDDGVMTDLGTLGGVSSTAVAINEHGDIVGQATREAGLPQATLWTPRR